MNESVIEVIHLHAIETDLFSIKTMAYTLSAEPRTVTGRQLDTLRVEKKVPGNLYGEGLKENQSVQFNLQDFRHVYNEAGESQVIELTTDAHTYNVLVKEVQINPLTREAIHVDFKAIDISKPVDVEVPLEYVGIAPAVKASGGSLIKKLNTVHVQCLPKDLVKFIEVPLVNLVTVEDTILVSDLSIPETLTLLTHKEDLVATVVPPKMEVEPVVAEAEEGAEAPAGGEAKPAEGGEAKKEEGKAE